MNVIVGCECSGVIREAFRKKGHNAWSCDLKPAEDSQQHHIQADIFEVLRYRSFRGMDWDMGIFHPPCTFISYVAKKWWNEPGRWKKRLDALDFFGKLLYCGLPRICVENPLGCADHVIEKHTQIIHPYYFGDSDMKKTCLWLKNLPPLVHTKHRTLFDERSHADKPEPTYVTQSGKKLYFVDSFDGGNDGGTGRSRSFPGIAQAMAEQWG